MIFVELGHHFARFLGARVVCILVRARGPARSFVIQSALFWPGDEAAEVVDPLHRPGHCTKAGRMIHRKAKSLDIPHSRHSHSPGWWANVGLTGPLRLWGWTKITRTAEELLLLGLAQEVQGGLSFFFHRRSSQVTALSSSSSTTAAGLWR